MTTCVYRKPQTVGRRVGGSPVVGLPHADREFRSNQSAAGDVPIPRIWRFSPLGPRGIGWLRPLVLNPAFSVQDFESFSPRKGPCVNGAFSDNLRLLKRAFEICGPARRPRVGLAWSSKKIYYQRSGL
jgi:hypothetical protein